MANKKVQNKQPMPRLSLVPYKWGMHAYNNDEFAHRFFYEGQVGEWEVDAHWVFDVLIISGEGRKEKAEKKFEQINHWLEEAVQDAIDNGNCPEDSSGVFCGLYHQDLAGRSVLISLASEEEVLDTWWPLHDYAECHKGDHYFRVRGGMPMGLINYFVQDDENILDDEDMMEGMGIDGMDLSDDEEATTSPAGAYSDTAGDENPFPNMDM